jgi:hypothetical protein
LRCLAYAGRTTSSFPAAFEPARPTVARPPADEPTEPDARLADDGVRVDMRGVCSEVGADDATLPGRVELVDGGVLDNIPVAWAVRAISSSPAWMPVCRWLLYLQPVPPDAKAPAATTDDAETRHTPRDRGGRRATRLVDIVRRSLSIKSDTESLLDDAEELRVVAKRARAAEAAHATADALVTAGAHAAIDGEVIAAYAAGVSAFDANRVATLLETPIDVLGGDPLPLPSAAPILTRFDANATSGMFLDACRALEHTAYSRPPTSLPDLAEYAISALPVVRAAMTLLVRIRARESEGGGTDPQLRDDLYETRLAAEAIVAARDRMLLATARERIARCHDDVPDTAAVASCIVTSVDIALAQHVAGLVCEPDAAPGEWREFALRLAARIIDNGASEPVSRAIAPESPAGSAVPANPAVVRLWTRVAWLTARFEHGTDPTPAERAAAMHAVLVRNVLVGPMVIDPLTESTPISFAAVTAADRSPLDLRVFGRAIDEVPDRIALKLSGNQLGNFAAFLSARWRHADWIWGRLDAAHTIAELLADRITPPIDSAEALRELAFCQASELVTELLDREWAAFELDDGNARERAAWVLTARIQLDILVHELPLLARLSEGRESPPSERVLDEARRSELTTVSEFDAAAHKLAAVGGEQVSDLTAKWDLRRTVVRAGLVAWSAIQPSGGLVADATRALLKPCKPLLAAALFAAVAPITAPAAAASAYVAAMQATGDIFSPFAYALCALTCLIAGVGVAMRVTAPRPTPAPPKRAGWRTVVLWAAIVLVLIALVVGAIALDRWWEGDIDHSLRRLALWTAVASVLSLLWLKVSRWYYILATAAVATGVGVGTVWALREVIPGWHWIASFAAVYAPLAAITVVLTLLYPSPPAQRAAHT